MKRNIKEQEKTGNAYFIELNLNHRDTEKCHSLAQVCNLCLKLFEVYNFDYRHCR